MLELYTLQFGIGGNHFRSGVNEVRHHVSLQVIDLDEGDVKTQRESFGKRCTDQQTAQQSRSARESDSAEFFLRDTCTPECSVHYRNNILLVCTTCQFGHHAAELLVHGLRSGHVAQQPTVTDNGSRGVVAT